MKKDSWQLKDVPNHFKTHKICERAVKVCPLLVYFKRVGRLWYDDYYDDDGGHWGDDDDDDKDKFFEWYDGYEKQKVQKAKI